MKLTMPGFFKAARPVGGKRGAVRDMIAGISLASMNIPQLLGYAHIAGMPLVAGLYTALLAPIGFAFFGSSRHLVVGADSATAAILAGGLRPLATPGGAQYVSLAATVALLVAAMLVMARLFRLGFLADFLSRTVLVGFLTGVGIQVAIAMLGGMLGIDVTGRSALAQLEQVARGLPHLSLPTLGLSVLLVMTILIGKRVAPRAPVTLAVVVATIAVSWRWNFASLGVATIGPVPGGLPLFGLSLPSWNETQQLIPIAASCFVVIIAQSAATARALAGKYGERLNEDDDILGLAAANAGAAVTGAFVVNGSPTQTAMADSAGARSQIAQITFAGCALVVVIALTAPLQFLPHCALAAIVFTIAVGMIDLGTLRAIRVESPGEFRLAVITTATVAFVGVEHGVLFAIALSLFRHVRQSYRPHTAVLQQGPEREWAETPATPGQESAPGLIIYRFGADLFYANATHFADEIRLLVDSAPEPVRWLVVEAEAMTNIDYSAARVAIGLINDLRRRRIEILFARVSLSLRADMDRHGVTAILGPDKIFDSRHEAVAMISADGADSFDIRNTKNIQDR